MQDVGGRFEGDELPNGARRQECSKYQSLQGALLATLALCSSACVVGR